LAIYWWGISIFNGTQATAKTINVCPSHTSLPGIRLCEEDFTPRQNEVKVKSARSISIL
jgi:hypothetical protein